MKMHQISDIFKRERKKNEEENKSINLKIVYIFE